MSKKPYERWVFNAPSQKPIFWRTLEVIVLLLGTSIAIIYRRITMGIGQSELCQNTSTVIGRSSTLLLRMVISNNSLRAICFRWGTAHAAGELMCFHLGWKNYQHCKQLATRDNVMTQHPTHAVTRYTEWHKPPDLDFKARKCFGGTHVLFRHTA